MTIELAEAEKFSNLTVFGFGFGLVFICLVCIILICLLMGFLCKKFVKEQKTQSNSSVSATPKKAEIANKGELVAAIGAAIAEDLGTDVSGLRILSIKEL